MSVSVTLSFKLPVRVEKQGKLFVARCPVLDVVTQGDTGQKARANLSDALYLFLVSCLERGTLDAVLKQCGFTCRAGKKKLPTNRNYIEVPIPFSADTRSHRCSIVSSLLQLRVVSRRASHVAPTRNATVGVDQERGACRNLHDPQRYLILRVTLNVSLAHHLCEICARTSSCVEGKYILSPCQSVSHEYAISAEAYHKENA